MVIQGHEHSKTLFKLIQGQLFVKDKTVRINLTHIFLLGILYNILHSILWGFQPLTFSPLHALAETQSMFNDAQFCPRPGEYHCWSIDSWRIGAKSEWQSDSCDRSYVPDTSTNPLNHLSLTFVGNLNKNRTRLLIQMSEIFFRVLNILISYDSHHEQACKIWKGLFILERC